MEQGERGGGRGVGGGFVRVWLGELGELYQILPRNWVSTGGGVREVGVCRLGGMSGERGIQQRVQRVRRERRDINAQSIHIVLKAGRCIKIDRRETNVWKSVSPVKSLD